MYIINDIPIICPQTWGLSNQSILFFELLTILRTDKAVLIYLNNISLHFNDYEEKSEKNAFFGLKYKYCYTKGLRNFPILFL